MPPQQYEDTKISILSHQCITTATYQDIEIWIEQITACQFVYQAWHPHATLHQYIAIPTYRHISVSIQQHFDVSLYEYIRMSMKHGILMPPYINTSTYQHIDISIYHYSNILVYQCMNISYLNISIRQHANISIRQHINLSIKYRILSCKMAHLVLTHDARYKQSKRLQSGFEICTSGRATDIIILRYPCVGVLMYYIEISICWYIDILM